MSERRKPTPLYAIDPGPEESAIVRVGDGDVSGNIHANHALLSEMAAIRDVDGRATLAIEWIESYGMPVGESVFNTVFWIGRFAEAWLREGLGGFALLPRRKIKLHLCNSPRAKDANVRQALLNRYGGDRASAVGTKKKPGPLYEFKSHMWSALAVAVTYLETEHGQSDI